MVHLSLGPPDRSEEAREEKKELPSPEQSTYSQHRLKGEKGGRMMRGQSRLAGRKGITHSV